MTKDQIIYCFTNPSYRSILVDHEIVKLGKTEDLLRRLSELFTTGVPTKFEVYRALVVPDMNEMEKRIHKHFKEYRVHPRREFFDSPLHKVDSLFDILLTLPGVEEYVEEEEDNKEEFEPKQSNFNTNISLYDIGCLDGEIIDMYGQNLKVVNSKESLVEYDGKPHALSSAATDLVIKNGGSGRRSGWKAGSWNGKLLVEYKKEYIVKVETE